jgi:hypothetical protein
MFIIYIILKRLSVSTNLLKPFFVKNSTDPFESKFGWDISWMILYKVSNFCMELISKMATSVIVVQVGLGLR